MRGVAIGFCAGLVLAGVASRPDAQPAPPAPAPDIIAKAKALYEAATTAMTDGRYPDAVRDFTAAYELTKDPVLLFKIGAANEKAGTCETALVYFARYLNEAKPEPRFVEATKEHVEACHGDWAQISGTAKGSDTGSAGSAGSGAPLGSASTDGSAAGSDAIGSDAGSGVPLATGSGAGEQHPSRGKDAPWLLVGGALAFVTAGVVLAYSASSSEQDIKDLYAGLGNGTPVFDAKNAERYQDLVDEGHRYQYLSWTSFGLAVGFGAVAAILFVREHNEAIRDANEHALHITPTASPTSAGVTATLHF